MRIPLIAATLALVAAPLAAQAADDSPTVLQLLQSPARLSIVDTTGRTVGQLVSTGEGTYTLRVIGTARAQTPRTVTTPEQPKALAPWQLEAQQRAEYEKVFGTPGLTGP